VIGFSTPEDFDYCAKLHRQYGTTYYFATLRFPEPLRSRAHAIYGFVRVPDEWVDNPGGRSKGEIAELLESYEAELLAGLEGVCPKHPALRAFVDVVQEAQIPIDEAKLFLRAMKQDLEVTRYATYADLEGYMRGSAAAVGLMMCAALDVPMDAELQQAACDLGNAMQLTNFLRDTGEDLQRGRIYLPQEDLARFGVPEAEVLSRTMSDRFIALMKFEIARARELYASSDAGIARLPLIARRPVKLARILYSRILDRIEANGYDVFTRRARTSRLEKLLVAGRELLLSR
jgi:phytoene synthase